MDNLFLSRFKKKIIHSALFKGLGLKLPDPSHKLELSYKPALLFQLYCNGEHRF
jgi:hypothetical protein